MIQDQGLRDSASHQEPNMAAKREMGHILFLMAWLLESLQQCNHWTFQSTWSPSWHVLKGGSNKMPVTCIIKQHKKLLHMQNPCHESKLWQLHSDDEELYEFFSLSSLLPDIIVKIRVWMRDGFVLLHECVTCQGTHQQLCYRSNPDGSIHWIALGDPLTARGGVEMTDKQKAEHKLSASRYLL